MNGIRHVLSRIRKRARKAKAAKAKAAKAATRSVMPIALIHTMTLAIPKARLVTLQRSVCAMPLRRQQKKQRRHATGAR